MFKNALISVADKSGLAEFAKNLQTKYQTRIVSTGGTAKLLVEAGVEVVDVSEQTRFQEVMDGRVKTLHPNVHMALLSRENHQGDLAELKKHDLEPFDLVVGNLYPFEKVASQSVASQSVADAELTELIDIGGPSFIRAAAKNFARIAVVCDPNDYQTLLSEPDSVEFRKKLSAKAFRHTSSYDAMIAAKLESSFEAEFGPWHSVGGSIKQKLRYGENPQQQAAWYQLRGQPQGLHSAEILQGKELSYNNLLDVDAAARCALDFSGPSCVAVKHTNPCAVAQAATLPQSVDLALKGDPVSVFGGIIALRGTIDATIAKSLTGLFLECVVAADVEPSALEILKKKPNLRVLKWPEILSQPQNVSEVRTVLGGYLVQSSDTCHRDLQEYQVVCGKERWQDSLLPLLEVAWKSCAHLKSNAIAIASSSGDAISTVGMGMGQVNRVDAVEQALQRMQKFHPETETKVLASDAFFPFPDSIELAAEAGIDWVIQPGGSIKDQDVINRANELQIGLLFTGVRHFRH